MKDCQITHFLKWTLPLAAALALAGCASHRPVDVSDQLAWWGELRPGERLELTQDTLLNGNVLELSARKATLTGYGEEKIYGPNVTVEMFRSNPLGWWSDLYLLPKGTDLRCVKLERWFSDEGALYRVSVEILSNGDHQGKIAFLIPWGDPNKKGSLELGPHSLVRPEEVATANGR